MNLLFRKISSNVCASISGVVLIGAFGAIAYSGSVSNSTTVNTQIKSQTVENVEVSSAETTTATQVVDIVKFKKASISEYDMSVTKASTKNTKKSAQKAKTNTNAAFTVEFPDNPTDVYDVHNEPLNFTATRSIANEYYTVKDIISGTTVTMNGHDIICQMVNSEIGETWDEEAIKAQAVAAYSCLRFNDDSGLIETVGLKAGYSSKLESCVNAVEGQVVTYNGQIINAVYSASTAGYSTTSKDIWGVSYPFLQCVKSEYDDQDPNWGIETTFSLEDVKTKLEEETGITLSDDPSKWFSISECYSGKYIRSVSIDGQTNISGSTLASIFGIKSTAMDISYTDNIFTFTSYGWGHGVGMSQWGACMYAKNGWTYDQILSHYYINTGLEVSSESAKAVQRGKTYTTETEGITDSTTDDSTVATTAPVTQEPTETTVISDSNLDAQNTNANQEE